MASLTPNAEITGGAAVRVDGWVSRLPTKTGREGNEMHINGHNPYKKGFDMLVDDIQEHEARCVTPSRCEPFSTKLSVDGVNRLGDTIADLRMEVARLRVIEEAAVACSEHPVWNDDQFYGLMTELQKALRGEVGADKTANV